MSNYDPDPLKLGLVATLTCVSCGRSRYGEVVATKEEDVIMVVDGPVLQLQLPNVRCTCGATRIRSGWLTGDNGYGWGDDGYENSLDDVLVASSPKVTSQTADAYWDTPTEPLPEPLLHQFRHSAGGQQWEADFEKMTLSRLMLGELFMSEEPVLYDLMRGPHGRLRMRPTEESRKIMVANIEERLADPQLSRAAAADRQDRAKLTALQQGYWLPVPDGIADALNERYLAFLRGR